MVKQLISMLDFVSITTDKDYKELEVKGVTGEKILIYFKALRDIMAYKDFLKLENELSFFVPCDKNGNYLFPPGSAPIYTHSQDYLSEYAEKLKTAKSKILFEGFEYEEPNQLWKNGKLVWFGGIKGTVEELVQLKLTLTETALKQIYET